MVATAMMDLSDQNVRAAATPPRDIDLRVGRNLRGIRKSRSLTQKDLGAGVGLTLQQIQKYENGSNRINVSRLHQFSEILGVPVSQFFAGPGEIEAKPPAEELPRAISPEDAELLAMFGQISPRMKRRVICLIEAMVEEAL